MNSASTVLFQDKKHYMTKLPISVLNVDTAYQKPLSKAHVKRIVAKFNPMGVGHIEVSKRADGTYWIFDGQHRTESYRTMGIQEIDCIVYEGLSIVDEANGYLYKNTTMKQTASQQFKVELEAKDPDALLISEILHSQGLKVYVKNEGGQIAAVKEVKRIYKKHGAIHLKTTISVLKESFGNDKNAYQGFVLGGVSEFIKKYENNPKYDQTFLIKRLKKVTLEGLISHSVKYSIQPGCGKPEAIKLATLQVYNSNKLPENRLDY